MNTYLALTLFSLIIIVYWIISELFTVFFRFTGLPDEKARFQVVSLLTGCGFTTKESELFLTSRARRRLARITMLFGYVFNITIVSAFINVFLSLKTSEILPNILSISIPLAVGILVIVCSRIPAVRLWIGKAIERLAGRLTHHDRDNMVILIDHIGNDVIAQVLLRKIPEPLQGLSLSESGIKSEYNVLVMLVDHGKAIPVDADTVFREGDKLTVFGSYPAICKVFEASESFTESEDNEKDSF